MPIRIVISPATTEKLDRKHEIKPHEVEQCFFNSTGEYFEDEREEHKTDPASLWFVAETDRGRKLKIVFVERDGNIYLKSAFAANEKAVRDYESLCNQEKK